MHFAFVGVCAESIALANTCIHLGHAVTWYSADHDSRQWATAMADKMQWESASWEAILGTGDVDGVVLGRAVESEADLRSEQWRLLTQDGMPLLVVHPVFSFAEAAVVDSLLVYLEIDMLARESGGVVQPFSQGMWQCPLDRTQLFGGNGDAAAVEQLILRRCLADRSKEDVMAWFARDAVVLDRLAGPFDELVAVGANAIDATFPTLSIQLGGPNGPPVRWEVAPADEHDSSIAELRTIGRSQFPSAQWRPSCSELECFITAIETDSRADEHWARACRAMELVDSMDISLRRGRKVELFYRQMSEQTSYKGVMSAWGCGLLTGGILLMMCAGMLDSVFGWRLVGNWYIVVLVAFVLFLLLQVFAKVVSR